MLSARGLQRDGDQNDIQGRALLNAAVLQEMCEDTQLPIAILGGIGGESLSHKRAVRKGTWAQLSSVQTDPKKPNPIENWLLNGMGLIMR